MRTIYRVTDGAGRMVVRSLESMRQTGEWREA